MERVTKVCICAFVLGAGLIAGCASTQYGADLNAFGDISIAGEFEDYWAAHGGLVTFGPPLDFAHSEGSFLIQTFLNAELMLDRSTPGNSSVELAPLGINLGLSEPAVSPQASQGSRYFSATGHMLYAGFSQVFEELGGEAVVGAPISEVKFRDGRIVQYFENLGLCRDENAAPSEVHLLALGLAAHPERSAFMVGNISYFLPPEIMLRPFADYLDRFGGESLFGPPLTEPFFTQDGSIEQIYERAAFFSNVSEASTVHMRRLGETLGPAEASVPHVEDPDGLYFTETGHNVRWAFAEFYRNNDGEVLLGLPLEESRIENDQLVQRFQNGILTYRYDLPSHLAVQLAPLGITYMQSMAAGIIPPTSAHPGTTPTPSELTDLPSVQVTTWPERFMSPLGSPQWIWIEVLRPDGSPWIGVEPLLVVHGPRGDHYPSVPATGTEGRTSLVLVLDDLRPGEIVNYDVIVSGEHGLGHAQGQFAATWSMPAQ
jgi:hypothetical protein